MNIRPILFAATLALPLTAAAEAPTPTKPAPTEKAAKLNADETKIIAHLHHVNVMEIDMGKDAKAKATAAVKRYGEMMIKDHTTADKELAAMAKKKGVAKIPAVQPSTDTEKAEMKMMMDEVAALKKLKGADYDKEYLRLMVSAHEKELAKSDVFIATAQDADLKIALEARKTVLQRHADAAKELQKGNAQASVAPDAPAKTSK
jgi:putative membrane protein